MPKQITDSDTPNYDMAAIQFARLTGAVSDCSSDTLELAASSSRFIEAAYRTREITDSEHSENINRINREIFRFKDRCKCLRTTVRIIRS